MSEPRERGVFQRQGSVWTLTFDGQTAQLADMRGLHDLARLLVRPGVDVHCLELADEALARADHPPVLGDQTRDAPDPQLASVSGTIGARGRPIGLGGAAERARSTVTWRIRSAVKKIGHVHERLGHHLASTVRTGTFCTYVPQTPIDWTL